MKLVSLNILEGGRSSLFQSLSVSLANLSLLFYIELNLDKSPFFLSSSVKNLPKLSFLENPVLYLLKFFLNFLLGPRIESPYLLF